MVSNIKYPRDSTDIISRIDLRPPEEKDEHSMNETGGTLNSIPSHTSNHPGSLTYQPPRFSVFLNRRRMGESTPAQRLRALRAVRNHNQNGEPVSNTTDAEGRETHGSASDLTDERTSRSNRVTRFFSRSESRVTTPSITALPTATTTATNTAEPSRNASSSNDQIPDVSSHH